MIRVVVLIIVAIVLLSALVNFEVISLEGVMNYFPKPIDKTP